MKTTSQYLIFAFCLLLSLISSGCHTIAGIGKDLQGGGKSIERSAKDTHQQMQSNNKQTSIQERN